MDRNISTVVYMGVHESTPHPSTNPLLLRPL